MSQKRLRHVRKSPTLAEEPGGLDFPLIGGELIGSAFAKGRDLLRGTLLFSGLSDQDADAILASAHRTRYPARATIFVKGAPGQSMMAILEGRVRISVPSSEGREAVFKIMGDGEIFGEIALLDGNVPDLDFIPVQPPRDLVYRDAANEHLAQRVHLRIRRNAPLMRWRSRRANC